MVTVDVSLNPDYGGTKVSTKYSPLLENQDIDPDGIPLNLDLLTSISLINIIYEKRIKLFESMSIWPNTLRFYSKYSETKIEEKIGSTKNYPMVVVSNNRSRFIAKCNDLWYKNFKKRIIIVVVHNIEYSTYRKNLDNLENFIVIGWNVDEGNKDSQMLLGFGGSRFAAFKLLKHLNQSVAWFIDDNVCSITVQKNQRIDSDKNIEDFEKILVKEKLTAISFKGANERSDFKDIPTSSKKKKEFDVEDYYQSNQDKYDHIKKGFKVIPIPFISHDHGVLQQLVLWNINLLGNCTISPYFLASKEDVTFSEFLIHTKPHPECRIYKIFRKFQILKLEIDKTEEDKVFSIESTNLQKKIDNLKKLVVENEEEKDGILYTSKLYKNKNKDKDDQSDLTFTKCITDLIFINLLQSHLIVSKGEKDLGLPKQNTDLIVKMIMEYSNLSCFKGLNPPIQAAEQLYRKSLSIFHKNRNPLSQKDQEKYYNTMEQVTTLFFPPKDYETTFTLTE